MRFIHTADWHIGQTINGWTREAEHRAFLAGLPDLVAETGADALIVAGDVFDGINPSNDSLRLYYDALATLNARHPRLTTVIVAGNHDSAGRLQAPDVLLRRFGVHVVAGVHRIDGRLDLDRHLVPLPAADGGVGAHVLAIPFLRPGDLPGLAFDDGADGSPVVAATRRLYGEAVAAARERIGAAPLIATGHLHCLGALESEGAERRIVVGGEHAVPADIFPADVAYVALGHLHRAQGVGRDTVRYAGSPFPLSATELPYRHAVTVVDVDPDGAVRWVERPLARPVPCLRLPETGALKPADLAAAVAALGLDPALPREVQPLVHVVLAPDGPLAGVVVEAERLLEAHPLRCAGIRIERPAAATEGRAPETKALRLSDWRPEDLFARAFETRNGVPPGPEHREAFRRLLVAE
ncbi:exonuclease SbcCD subunit D [Oharaeibacter diazotrophicus]|uniref:Nuclease SbcCD subunit D n=2 Tax=Oharaeibacter diazotrophicus TaxID=1920512 RepID=A0A4R6RI59_9HYPH|nr:exonuclease subunit SbcD [Oharaeibacter diazotrophicus]TDP86179.1 exodeoxyribonuclease I subunit D [Oharaeibacter diazotrophicus]BBE71880.1 nuclease SbcCD subunit D [Pleomorphomonas sp. SM30]GLS78644.1 nuclease SbcCD subunit D [Oharaeibacter diazotrophicus]